MLTSINSVLENESYIVIESADGKEVVTAFNDHHPDCVLLDGLMPNLGGFRHATK